VIAGITSDYTSTIHRTVLYSCSVKWHGDFTAIYRVHQQMRQHVTIKRLLITN